MITKYGASQALDRILRSSLDVSLHSADPSTTGANELSGSGYARQSISDWHGPQALNAISNTTLEFSTDGTTVTHLGLWRSTTFIWGVALDESLTGSSPSVPMGDLVLLLMSSSTP